MTDPGWLAEQDAKDDVDVTPIGDLIGHEPGDTCPCQPVTEPVERDDGSIGWLYVHNAWDGRE